MDHSHRFGEPDHYTVILICMLLSNVDHLSLVAYLISPFYVLQSNLDVVLVYPNSRSNLVLLLPSKLS